MTKKNVFAEWVDRYSNDPVLFVKEVLGVDPVHFGVIVVMNLSLGTFTPPFGINLFVGQAVFKLPLSVLYRGILPFFVASLGALALVTYVPDLSLYILRFL